VIPLHIARRVPYHTQHSEQEASTMGDKSPKNTKKSQKQKVMKAQNTPKPTTGPVKK